MKSGPRSAPSPQNEPQDIAQVMPGIGHQGDRVRPEPEAEFHGDEGKIQGDAEGEGAGIVRGAAVIVVVVVLVGHGASRVWQMSVAKER